MNKHQIILCICLISLISANAIRVIQTARNTNDRMTEKPSINWGADFTSANTLMIDENMKFQKILGYGGAFTEAAGLNFAKLSPADREKVMQLYFNKDSGIGYTFGRVPMNSCDFSTDSYSYDGFPGDFNLTQFDTKLTRETKAVLPMIWHAMKVGGDIKMFLSPWSPPAWMKVPVNGKQSMMGSAKPNGLNETCQASWALYFTKFMEAYKNYGVEFWGLTVQNEPEFAAPWEACAYTAEYQRDFIKNHLGPLVKSKFPNVKIMAYDHNRDHIADWTRVMASDPLAAKYVDGMAFHWYVTNNYANLVKSHNIAPNMFLLNTEGCSCPPEAGSFDIAELYGADYINDLNNWAVGFVDWNLMLDDEGSPNHLANYCDAPMKRDHRTNALIIEPSFYYIGQVSKFVVPNSVRIGFRASVTIPKTNSKPNSNDGDNVFMWHCDNSPRQSWTSKFALSNSNMCLDVANHDVNDGANVQVWGCSGEGNQKWTYDTTSQHIVNGDSGKCLTMEDTPADGVNVEIRSCSNTDPNQKFVITSDNTVASAMHPEMCVTATGPVVTYTAVKTPKGEVVVLLMNMLDDVTMEIKLGSSKGYANVKVPPHSIQTLVY